MIINSLNIPFLKRNSLLPPYPALLSEKYLTKGGGDISLAQSFCAKGDGATGYISTDADIVTSTRKIRAKFNIKELSSSDGKAAIAQDGGTRGWTISLNGDHATSSRSIRIQIGYGDSAPASRYSFDATTILNADTWYNLDVKIIGNSTLNRFEISITYNGTTTETTTISGASTIYGMGNKLRVLASGLANSNLNGYLSDVKLWKDNIEDTDSPVFNMPLQGSTLDISGYDNHGTVHGTVDLYETQRFFHYNIMYGFDDYTDDATGLIHVYVPYVDGSPVVASITDYTKQTSNPAGIFHNGAETKVVPFTSSHDGTGWVVPADIKAIDTNEILHDAGTGYGKELSYADLAAIDEDYLFVDTTTALQYKNIMLYTEALTGVELVKADKFVGN